MHAWHAVDRHLFLHPKPDYIRGYGCICRGHHRSFRITLTGVQVPCSVVQTANGTDNDINSPEMTTMDASRLELWPLALTAPNT